jgi:hypothetical protein
MVERSRLRSHSQQNLGPLREVGRGKATLEEGDAVLETTDVEGDRARVDAHDARHQRAAARS